MPSEQSDDAWRIEIAEINARVKDIMARSDRAIAIIDRELPQMGEDIRAMGVALAEFAQAFNAMEDDHFLAESGVNEWGAQLDTEDQEP